MELIEAMHTAAAVRRFRPDPVSDDVLYRVLDAARHPAGIARERIRPGYAAQAAASWVVQYLHLVASAGMSAARQLGQVFVGTGSPKTVVPRCRM
jgi:hypothetical protein